MPFYKYINIKLLIQKNIFKLLFCILFLTKVDNIARLAFILIEQKLYFKGPVAPTINFKGYDLCFLW